MQAWLQTLCKSVETQAEALRSIADLYLYCESDVFIISCGEVASARLTFWLRNSFFNVEGQLLFWHRVQLRHFDEYVNSVCEGQNSAAKSTNTGTKASYNVNTMANCLDYRSEIKQRLRDADAEKRKQKTPLYSNTEAGREVMAYAELNAHEQCKGWTSGKDRYWLWKGSAKTMWVMLKQHVPTTSPGVLRLVLQLR